MGDRRPLSVTKGMAGLGGGLLIAAFFLPLLATSNGDVGPEIFGVRDLRAQLEEARGVEATRPFIEPALRQLDLFSVTPSLRNFSGLTAAAREVLDAAVAFGVDDADKLRRVSTALALVRACLWLLPLVGLVQLVVPLTSLLRGYAGAPGLVARFAFGLLFLLVAIIPLAAVPVAEQSLVGSAVWALLTGAALMMLAGLFGVTRGNALPVLAIDALLVVLAGVAVVRLADALGG